MSTIVTRAGKGSPLTHTEVDTNFTNLNTDKAEDSSVVKLTGDQTIAGTKTFSSTITGSISGNAGTVTNGVYTSGSYADPSWITSLDDGKVLPSMTSNSGKYLTTDGTNSSWAAVDALPSQTGNSGKYLTTDGSTASWATINVTPALDDLSDVTITSVSSGQVLKYNGSAWVNATDSGNTTTNGLYEHSNTISANYSISSGNNAMTAGTITINSGVTVTVPTGSTWVIV